MARKNMTPATTAIMAPKNETPAPVTSTPVAPTLTANEEKTVSALCKLASTGWDGFGRQDVLATFVAGGLTPEQASAATENLRAPYTKAGRALPKSQGEPIFRAMCESGEWRARCLASLRGALAGTLTATVAVKPGSVTVK